jgi:hypothetical protein
MMIKVVNTHTGRRVWDQEDGKGISIACPEQKGEPSSTLLRCEFYVKASLLRATVVLCGLGQYEMSLNGMKTMRLNLTVAVCNETNQSRQFPQQLRTNRY